LSNQKQLALAWEMYANENGGTAVGTSTFPAGGTPGVTPPDPMDWRTDVRYVLPAVPQSSDQAVIQATEAGFQQPMKTAAKTINGPLYQYAPNPNVIHCPGDMRTQLAVGSGFAWDSYSGVQGINGESGGPLSSGTNSLRVHAQTTSNKLAEQMRIPILSDTCSNSCRTAFQSCRTVFGAKRRAG
jgi:hypothetical protein